LTTHHFKTLRLIIAADQASMSQISDRLGAKCCHNDFYFQKCFKISNNTGILHWRVAIRIIIHWHTQSNTFVYGTRSLCRGCSYESEWKWGSEIDFSCTGQGIGNGCGPGDLSSMSFCTVVLTGRVKC